MDTIVLGFFVSATFIGIYEAAWGLASLLATVSSSIQNTLFPEMSELSERDDYERIHHYLNEGLVFSGIFIIPGIFGSLVIGQRVLQFYRPEFGRGAGILIILVLAYGADVYGSQFLNTLNAIDRPDIAFRVNVVFVAVNLVLNVALVATVGWYGAAVATMASTALRFALGYRQLATVIGAPEVPLLELGKQGLAAAIMAVVVSVARPYPPSNRAGTLALVATGAAVYLVLLLAFSTRVREKGLNLLPTSRISS
jgi:O-antigen/teichoic acid export membrane protein